MPRDGSGNYSLPAGNPVVTGTTISSTVQNNTTSDIATALTASIAKDGQTTPTANLPMGGFAHTGVADATSLTQYPSVKQVQNNSLVTLSVSGTNTIAGTSTPAVTAYASGQRFWFIPAGANSSSVTLNVNGLGAKNVFSRGVACSGGEIMSGVPVEVYYDGTQFHITSLPGWVGPRFLGSVSGTNTITGTSSPSLGGYFPGLTVRFIPANTNTSTATINIDGLGAKNVLNKGVGCRGYEMPAGCATELMYDGTQFHIVGQTPTRVLIGQVTAAGSSTLDITNVNAGSFDYLEFAVTGLFFGTTGNFAYMRFSTDNGASYVSTSSYSYIQAGNLGSAPNSFVGGGSSSDTKIAFANSVVNSSPCNIFGTITGNKVLWKSAYVTTTPENANFSGFGDGPANANAYRILPLSGTLSSGTFSIYGCR